MAEPTVQSLQCNQCNQLSYRDLIYIEFICFKVNAFALIPVAF